MTGREWKPGDLATGSVGGYDGRFVFRGRDGWDEVEGEDGGWDGDFIQGLRPLVVIDPGPGTAPAADLVKALRQAAENDAEVEKPLSWLADQIAEQVQPPKPAEPTGLGAVVEDAHGSAWVRISDLVSLPWRRARVVDTTFHTASSDWQNIAAVRVLSEGIQ